MLSLSTEERWYQFLVAPKRSRTDSPACGLLEHITVLALTRVVALIRVNERSIFISKSVAVSASKRRFYCRRRVPCFRSCVGASVIQLRLVMRGQLVSDPGSALKASDAESLPLASEHDARSGAGPAAQLRCRGRLPGTLPEHDCVPASKRPAPHGYVCQLMRVRVAHSGRGKTWFSVAVAASERIPFVKCS